MAAFFRRRFRWKNGQVVVELPDDEQDMLRHVLPQLRELVMGETDPALRRLRRLTNFSSRLPVEWQRCKRC